MNYHFTAVFGGLYHKIALVLFTLSKLTLCKPRKDTTTQEFIFELTTFLCRYFDGSIHTFQTHAFVYKSFPVFH